MFSTDKKNNFFAQEQKILFFRVHYPLPLTYDEESNPLTLKKVLAALRKEVAELKQDKLAYMEDVAKVCYARNTNSLFRSTPNLISFHFVKLARENAELKKRIVDPMATEAHQQLQKEIKWWKDKYEGLLREKKKSEDLLHNVQQETNQQIHVLQEEFDFLTSHVSAKRTDAMNMEAQISRLQNLVSQLLGELKTSKINTRQLMAQKENEIAVLKSDIKELQFSNISLNDKYSSSTRRGTRSVSASSTSLNKNRSGSVTSVGSATRRVGSTATSTGRRNSSASATSASSTASKKSRVAPNGYQVVKSRPLKPAATSPAPSSYSNRYGNSGSLPRRSTSSSGYGSYSTLNKSSASESPSRSSYKRFDPTAYVRDKQKKLEEQKLARRYGIV